MADIVTFLEAILGEGKIILLVALHAQEHPENGISNLKG